MLVGVHLRLQVGIQISSQMVDQLKTNLSCIIPSDNSIMFAFENPIDRDALFKVLEVSAVLLLV